MVEFLLRAILLICSNQLHQMSPKEFNYNFLQCNGENEWNMKNQIKLFLFFQSTPPIAKITCVKNEMTAVFCGIIILHILKKKLC